MFLVLDSNSDVADPDQALLESFFGSRLTSEACRSGSGSCITFGIYIGKMSPPPPSGGRISADVGWVKKYIKSKENKEENVREKAEKRGKFNLKWSK